MNIDRIVNILLMISALFSILFNITIVIIHIKQPLLKNGFFIVVFGQIITEFLISIAIFFQNFFYFINSSEYMGKWFAVFPILFNFCYEANIIYNIRIIIYLSTYNKDKDELINYAMDNDITRNSDLSHQASISIIDVSFKNIHILSYSIATIYIIFYILNLFLFQEQQVEEKGWNWYFYFICGKRGFYRIFFFIFHLFYFCLSIYYLIKSCDKNKISNHIYLRSYAIFCLFSSFISVTFPVSLLIFMFGFQNNEKEFKQDYLILILLAFFIFLIATTIFRIKNYYVNYVLTQDGNNCLSRFSNIVKILFCCKKMKELNFVDLNSSFIYHALSSSNDLIIEDVPDTTIVQNELITRES